MHPWKAQKLYTTWSQWRRDNDTAPVDLLRIHTEAYDPLLKTCSFDPQNTIEKMDESIDAKTAAEILEPVKRKGKRATSTEERAKSRAELRKKIEELQKAEQKAKPSSTNQNNQNNQKNNMNMNDNDEDDEDSPNEDDSDDGHVAVCGVASAEAIAASHASDPGGHCGRPQSPRLTAATGSSPPSESG